jgi:hypothetical protein
LTFVLLQPLWEKNGIINVILGSNCHVGVLHWAIVVAQEKADDTNGRQAGSIFASFSKWFSLYHYSRYSKEQHRRTRRRYIMMLLGKIEYSATCYYRTDHKAANSAVKLYTSIRHTNFASTFRKASETAVAHILLLSAVMRMDAKQIFSIIQSHNLHYV